MSSSQIPGSTSVLVSRMQLVGRRNEMNLSAIPTVTQVNNTVTFEVPFAFYAGNAKLPAGSYTVTQPDDNAELLLIESADRSHSVFVEYVADGSDTPPSKTEITFSKYANAEFLSRISV